MSSMHNNLYPGLNLGSLHKDANEKAEKVVYGFWVFLMSDAIIFGLLFGTYASYLDPMGMAGAPGPAQLFDIKSIGIQTLLLLFGGVCYGGVTFSTKYKRGTTRIILWLLLCAVLGLSFLFFEIRDFANQASIGGTPDASAWLSSYWALVGLHGLHVFAGVLWILNMVAQINKYGMDDTVKVRIMMLGVFWHFLDLIWVGIFSFVFLVPLS